MAEENKDRQIIVARKNKERTDAVETERVLRCGDKYESFHSHPSIPLDICFSVSEPVFSHKEAG